MKYLLLFMLATLVSLSSCMTTEKAASHFDQNQQEAAEYCASRFPAKSSTDTKTETHTKETEVPGPVLDCPDVVNPETGAKETPRVQCPPCLQRETTTSTTTATTEIDTAPLRAAELRLEQAKEENQELKDWIVLSKENNAQLQKGRNSWRIVSGVLGVLLVGLIVLLFRR